MLVPYEKLSLEWLPDQSLCVLSLPWIKLQIEVDNQNKEWFSKAVFDLKNDPFSPVAQEFLKSFEDYAIYYMSPRSSANLVFHEKNQNLFTIDTTSPLTFCQSLHSACGIHLESTLPESWTWDIESILARSKVESHDFYDPLALVTYLIGVRLDEESKLTSIKTDLPKNLDHLRQKDESLFFDVMKSIVRQTHYVTSHMLGSVEPALKNFHEARTIITKFMNEEKGHDRLMSQALKELGCNNPLEITPFESVILLLDLLKKAATESPLAFTLMIGHFEGRTFEETDPLADVLARSSRPKSARGYALHHDINTREQHNKIIFQLAEKLSIQYREEAKYAMRILEFAQILDSIVSHKLYNMSIGEER